LAFYYDVARITASNATPNTASTHLWAKTIANQESVGIKAIITHAQNFGTAGSAALRVYENTGTTASGGTGQIPHLANMRAPAAQSVWANDATSITPGVTLFLRRSIGFAQTGGNGGWVAIEPSAALQMMPNAANPVDMEFVSLAFTASVPIDFTVEFSEGA
jgi:hypothetical protein